MESKLNSSHYTSSSPHLGLPKSWNRGRNAKNNLKWESDSKKEGHYKKNWTWEMFERKKSFTKKPKKMKNL